MKHRKLLLAHVRKGNYAHAGEEEAINFAMRGSPKKNGQLLLDVGCGLGGTANYIKNNNWGRVTGIDIDKEVINYAKNQYSHIDFKCCDVINVERLFNKKKFDIVYSFNAYFCFPFQEKSLKALASIAKNDSDLIIFDYASPGLFNKRNPFDNQMSLVKKTFSPINISTIYETLLSSGWLLKSITDLTEKFIKWYQTFIKNMDMQKKELINYFGEDTYNEVHNGYSNLLSLIYEKEVGGALIHATRKFT